MTYKRLHWFTGIFLASWVTAASAQNTVNNPKETMLQWLENSLSSSSGTLPETQRKIMEQKIDQLKMQLEWAEKTGKQPVMKTVLDASEIESNILDNQDEYEIGE